MSRIKPIHTARLVAIIGVLAGLLLLGGSRTISADGDEEPVNVIAYANAPGAITIVWEHSGDDVYWFVLEQEAPFGFTTPDRDKRIWTVTGLEPGTTYRYRVCAVYDYNRVCSDWSNNVTTLPPQAPPSRGSMGGGSAGINRPPAPVLRATARAVSEIYLSWEHPGYEARLTSAALYRDGAFIYEALQPGNFDSDHVDIVQPNSSHRYHFCFSNAAGETCSAPLTRSPLPLPPTAPTNVQVGEFTATSAVIRWQPGTGADEYTIHCLDLTDGSHCGFPYREHGGRMGVDRVRNPDQPVYATTYYTLRVLQPGHRYEVAVCASQDNTKYGLPVSPVACAPGLIVTGNGTIERCTASACQVIQGERRTSEGLAAPADLTGTLSAARTSIVLRWTASPGATSYELRATNEDSGLYYIRKLSGDTTSYTDEIGPNQTGEFIYELKACAADGCSQPVTIAVRLS